MASQAPMMQPQKRVFIETYGCQMNVYDSERMRELLSPIGYGVAESLAEADLVILNTCHIREKATEKVYSELGRVRNVKEARKAEGKGETRVIVAGCVAQAEGEEIIARAPVVDFVVGPQAYHRLPELLARDARARGERLAAAFEAQAKFDELGAMREAQGVSAFLSVQEGCDKFCSFCVVPYTRGAEYSRPSGSILAEARSLLASGARELVLLGQNVNAYHGAGPDGAQLSLAGLLRLLAPLDGLLRLRFTTSHPKEMGGELIALFGEEPKLAPYLHLPVQSGSDAILAAMNRKHTAADYLASVQRLRQARPDLALSTDFIVGFPGETEADFEATLALVQAVGFASAYSFKYSPRPGTPAAAMRKQVAEEVKTARLARLQDLLAQQQRAFNEDCIGKRMSVLVSGPGRKPGQMAGRSPYLQAVHFEGPADLVGREVAVVIEAASQNSLAARIAPAGAAA